MTDDVLRISSGFTKDRHALEAEIGKLIGEFETKHTGIIVSNVAVFHQNPLSTSSDTVPPWVAITVTI